jgi:hypothetical protein
VSPHFLNASRNFYVQILTMPPYYPDGETFLVESERRLLRPIAFVWRCGRRRSGRASELLLVRGNQWSEVLSRILRRLKP